MLIVGLVVTFAFGWYCCSQWGNHRAKYLEKQLKKAIVFCDTMRDTNEILVGKVNRLNQLGVREDENSLDCKVDRGMLRAIADMQSDAMVH